MDIKGIIDDVVSKVRSDENFKEKFFDDPTTTIEETFNINLPNEHIDPIVEGVKAKLNLEKVDDMLDNAKKFF
ncbi:hypothetical protein SAMN05421839_10956 [Halolactibacillus halophilus]|uniref:Uncharacterized protein n=1 Tax=Halolactibacillus halophilus TaxID=306540 RepID=A0A1I5NHN8_9BACI|nr:hypothetical protein [Halolactibacillus halophilus]GEM01343.1 hypothetical protein HHA03_08750 [Halolactibacillus halophilus]SFP21323.1 hypothetical protein SAMN05421839_10956 [Halolactibacillus halophilus]